MTKVADAGRGVHMSDGTMNVALLEFRERDGAPGLIHFGLWVDDIEQAEAQVLAAGARRLGGPPPKGAKGFYEVKYEDPSGLVFDLTASGWAGATKDKAASS